MIKRIQIKSNYQLIRLWFEFYKLALIALSAITFFPHWGHDYVFLLPLVLISYKNFYNILGKINFLFIYYIHKWVFLMA
jgi:hypothetical protein